MARTCGRALRIGGGELLTVDVPLASAARLATIAAHAALPEGQRSTLTLALSGLSLRTIAQRSGVPLTHIRALAVAGCRTVNLARLAAEVA